MKNTDLQKSSRLFSLNLLLGVVVWPLLNIWLMNVAENHFGY